jgi:hypothetical protein
MCTTRLGDDWIDTGTMCRAQSSLPGLSLFSPALPKAAQLTPVEDGIALDAEGKAFVRNADGSFEDATITTMSVSLPVIAGPTAASRLDLQALVDGGRISKAEASKRFRAFIEKQVYSNQLEGGQGFCVCASRQMALKHAGIIRLGLSYNEIKRGLRNETSSNVTKPGQWEYWHFNENVKGKSGKVFFSHESKLHPDAIGQIARNANVGTGSGERLRWTQLMPPDARRFLDAGAMVVVGTKAPWMTAVHDPFKNVDLFVDPIADKYRAQGARRIKEDGDRNSLSMYYTGNFLWEGVIEYHGLVRE